MSGRVLLRAIYHRGTEGAEGTKNGSDVWARLQRPDVELRVARAYVAWGRSAWRATYTSSDTPRTESRLAITVPNARAPGDFAVSP